MIMENGKLLKSIREIVSEENEKTAVWVQNEFLNVGKRFDGIDRKIDGLDGRMDGLEGRMGNLENRMDNLSEEVGDIKRRTENIENKLDNVVFQDEFKETNKKTEKRVRILELKAGIKAA
jgi:chromosome segregation ATPase